MSLNLEQRKAVEKLSRLKAGALFMGMGSGKTKVACDLIRCKLDCIDAVIWIAPAALVNSQKYLGEVKEGIKISNNPTRIKNIPAPKQLYFIIFDFSIF